MRYVVQGSDAPFPVQKVDIFFQPLELERISFAIR
jgi:hypothetical protein